MLQQQQQQQPTEADIVRHRFLEREGGVTGGNAGLTGLVKRYQQLLQAIQTQRTAVGNQDGANGAEATTSIQQCYQQLVLDLDVTDQQVTHLQHTFNTHQLEFAEYQHQHSLMNDSITQTQQQIRELQQKLQQAKQWRRQQEEYQLLATKIQQLPSRQHTLQQIESMQQQISAVEQAIRQHDDSVEQRQKQYKNAIHALSLLQPVASASASTDIKQNGVSQSISVDDVTMSGTGNTEAEVKH